MKTTAIIIAFRVRCFETFRFVKYFSITNKRNLLNQLHHLLVTRVDTINQSSASQNHTYSAPHHFQYSILKVQDLISECLVWGTLECFNFFNTRVAVYNNGRDFDRTPFQFY